MERDKDFEKYLEKLGVPPMTEEQKRNLQGIYDGSYKGKDKPGVDRVQAEKPVEPTDAVVEPARKIGELHFSCKNPELWNSIKDKSQNPGGQSIFSFAERWVELMEEKMKEGGDLSIVAEEMIGPAENSGREMSGAGFGRAVALLSETWTHGDELLAWYNLRQERIFGSKKK
ncbi:MAG: hypothetical protein V1716_03420 [Candidatus Uhrbacteria bacterium]